MPESAPENLAKLSIPEEDAESQGESIMNNDSDLEADVSNYSFDNL